MMAAICKANGFTIVGTPLEQFYPKNETPFPSAQDHGAY